MEQNNKIKSFTDLRAWKFAMNLALEVYKITKLYPKEELFALTSQTRRCVVSISANIAEGFSRKTWKDKIQFYTIALGSLTELQSHLFIAHKLDYLDKDKFKKIASSTVDCSKLINGLIKKSKSNT